MPTAAVRQDGEALPLELEELFLEHCQMIHRTAYAITAHRQDAEDVLQSIFVKLLQLGVTPDVRQHPARYLHRAAVNLSINVLRTRKRRRRVDWVDALEIPASAEKREDERDEGQAQVERELDRQRPVHRVDREARLHIQVVEHQRVQGQEAHPIRPLA